MLPQVKRVEAYCCSEGQGRSEGKGVSQETGLRNVVPNPFLTRSEGPSGCRTNYKLKRKVSKLPQVKRVEVYCCSEGQGRSEGKGVSWETGLRKVTPIPISTRS